MSVKKAIILAAGMGTRLKPLTEKNHKCLTEVNGKQILRNALEQLEAIGVEETIIVIGYLGDQIKRAAGVRLSNMKISYVCNEIFDKTNTSYSLKLALQALSNYDEVYILEGDVFFEYSLLVRFSDLDGKNVTVLDKYNCNLDGTFAEVDDDFYVIDWVHKSKRPCQYNLHDKYKTVNIHKFTKDFIDERLYAEIKLMEETNNGTDPIENVMRNIVKGNHKTIKGFDAYGMKWFEIDDMDDLKIAEELFL